MNSKQIKGVLLKYLIDFWKGIWILFVLIIFLLIIGTILLKFFPGLPKSKVLFGYNLSFNIACAIHIYITIQTGIINPIKNITELELEEFKQSLIKAKISFYRTQFNDLLLALYPLSVPIIASVLAYNIQTAAPFLILLKKGVVSLALILLLAIIAEVFLKVKFKRLLEQLKYSGDILGESDLRNNKLLQKIMFIKMKNSPDLHNRLFVLLVVMLVTFFYIVIFYN
ncbi:MAG: hypothetical protein K0R49_340 [Burkholderiales bacterium]|jgi:hypothetical protein|nr:hypothetical protein [Burkholderiales bacterium]